MQTCFRGTGHWPVEQATKVAGCRLNASWQSWGSQDRERALSTCDGFVFNSNMRQNKSAPKNGPATDLRPEMKQIKEKYVKYFLNECFTIKSFSLSVPPEVKHRI